MLMTDSWNTLNGNLSTGHIIALVFFILIIVAIIAITIAFFIYKNHIKKIYEIDRKLTLLLNNPIEGKVKRLGNISNNIDEYSESVVVIKSMYIVAIARSLSETASLYKKQLQNKSIYKLKPAAFVATKGLLDELDKIESEINFLNTATDVVIRNELLLRDHLVEFMKEWKMIEERYNSLNENSKYDGKLIPYKRYNLFVNKKNELLAKFDESIKKGDYEQAKQIFDILISLQQKFLVEVELLPVYLMYFKNNLPHEMEALRDASTTNEMIGSLRRNLDTSIEAVNELLQNNKYFKVILKIKDINEAIVNFKKERQLENAFVNFVEMNENHLNNFFNDLQNNIYTLEQEDSEEFNQATDEIKKSISKPIENINKILEKISKKDSKRHLNDYLNNQRNAFEENLVKLNEGIKLLKLVKTESSKDEQEYLEWLTATFKTKSLLLSLESILNNSNNGLSEKRVEKNKQYLEQLWQKLNELDLENYEQYSKSLPTKSMKRNYLDQANKLLYKVENFYQEILEEYQYFGLAKSIVNYHLYIKDFGYPMIWDKLMNFYNSRTYKEFVKNYIQERKNIN